MANETVLVFETEKPIPMTVANATAITKGAVLRLTDPFTASATTLDNDIIAGIAWGDKIASDGVTALSVYRGGIFKGTASGSISVGDPLMVFGGTNLLGTQDITGQTLSGQRCLGTALETCTNGETFLFELNPSQVWPSI